MAIIEVKTPPPAAEFAMRNNQQMSGTEEAAAVAALTLLTGNRSISGTYFAKPLLQGGFTSCHCS
jgi:anaerobic selenocysteine-containing dehydrogenase